MARINSKSKKNVCNVTVFLILCLLATIITILKPYFSGKFIDSITYMNDRKEIFKIAILYAALLLAGILLSYFIKIIIIIIKNDMSSQFKFKIIEHYHNIPLLEALAYDAGYIYNRIAQDIDYLVIFFLDNIISVISNMIVIITSIVLLAKVSMKIFYCSVTFLPVYLLLYLYMKKRFFIKNKNYREQVNIFSNVILEQFSMIKEIKIASNHENVKERLNSKYNVYLKNVLDFHMFSEKFKSIDGYLSVIFQIVTMLIGALEIINNNMTIGQFMIITSYFSYLLSAVKFYADLGKNYQEAKVAKKRLDEIMNVEEEQEGKVVPDDVNKVEVLDLSFSYDKSDKVINDFTYKFKKNQSYCISGKNGVGKSTFVNILAGLYEDYSGKILYDGIELKEINKKYLREKICIYMPQTVKCQDFTVREYIEYYYSILTSFDFKRSLKDYGIDEIYYNDKFNIDEYWNKKCCELSGGEWQKIRLLCAITAEAKIIILDEPTAAWDDESKAIFNHSIDRMAKNRILIIISHDEELAENCTCICNM